MVTVLCSAIKNFDWILVVYGVCHPILTIFANIHYFIVFIKK